MMYNYITGERRSAYRVLAGKPGKGDKRNLGKT